MTTGRVVEVVAMAHVLTITYPAPSPESAARAYAAAYSVDPLVSWLEPETHDDGRHSVHIAVPGTVRIDDYDFMGDVSRAVIQSLQNDGYTPWLLV